MNLNLISPINSLGYGIAGGNILKALKTAGVNVSFFPIGNVSWEGDVGFIQEAAQQAKLFDKNAPCLRIFHQHSMDMWVGNGKKIGWPIFELDTFTQEELHHLDATDELVVCSQWANDILVSNGIDKPIHVVPLGVDSNIFHLDENARTQKPYWTRDKVVFLNVGKWEVRKGHEELLEAFNKAFTDEDDVELWMINHNPFIGMGNEQWKLKYLSSPLGAKIKCFPRINSQAELARIFNIVDYCVAPAHAEGFNLEPLEMMACGVPCIATNYSGHTEYMKDRYNSLLVQPNGMEPAVDKVDNKWFFGQGNWCTFSIYELADRMREAYDFRLDTKDTHSGGYHNLHFGALETAKRFTWEASVAKLIEVLK